MKIKMKPRGKQNEEKWIGELLDHVDEEKLLEMSAIHSDIPMPVPNQEKLAQSVIDKADLADEKEMERRRAFEKAYRRKKLIRGSIVVGCVAVVFTVLALCGVFDNVLLDKYSYQIEAAVVAGGTQPEVSPQFDEKNVLSQRYTLTGAPITHTDDLRSSVNVDTLENTVYDAVARYCEKNHYAVDECEIARTWYYEEKGKTVLMCEVAATFMRLDEESGGQETITIEPEEIQQEADWPYTLESYLTIDRNEILSQQSLSDKQGLAMFLLAVDVPAT